MSETVIYNTFRASQTLCYTSNLKPSRTLDVFVVSRFLDGGNDLKSLPSLKEGRERLTQQGLVYIIGSLGLVLFMSGYISEKGRLFALKYIVTKCTG